MIAIYSQNSIQQAVDQTAKPTFVKKVFSQ